MATRKIYADDAGKLFFKGEGFRFYLHPRFDFVAGDKLTVLGVSCGQTGAGASFLDKGGMSWFVTSSLLSTAG